MPLDPTYPLVPVLNFLGVFLVLIPLPWQLQSWNSGICMTMIWTAVGCLVRGVNAVVWKDNVVDWVPWWCDISSHLIIGGSVAIPAASFSIVRRLFKISRMNGVPTTREEKRKELVIDLSLCLGLPILLMSLYIVVQGQRYSILEQVGCTTYVVNTPLLYILILIWPVLLGLGSTVLSPFILRALKTRRKELNSYLNTNANANKDDNQSLSISSHPGTRFTRLTLLSLVDTILTVPLSIFVIVANTLMSPVRPYPGWSATHADFGFIPQIPADVWRNPLDENGIDPASATMRRMNLAGAYFSAFVYAFCAVVVFAFFGWSEEVRSGYVGLWWKIAGWFGMERKKQRSKRKEEATIAFATAPGGRDAASRHEALTFNLTNLTALTSHTHDFELSGRPFTPSSTVAKSDPETGSGSMRTDSISMYGKGNSNRQTMDSFDSVKAGDDFDLADDVVRSGVAVGTPRAF